MRDSSSVASAWAVAAAARASGESASVRCSFGGGSGLAFGALASLGADGGAAAGVAGTLTTTGGALDAGLDGTSCGGTLSNSAGTSGPNPAWVRCPWRASNGVATTGAGAASWTLGITTRGRERSALGRSLCANPASAGLRPGKVSGGTVGSPGSASGGAEGRHDGVAGSAGSRGSLVYSGTTSSSVGTDQRSGR